MATLPAAWGRGHDPTRAWRRAGSAAALCSRLQTLLEAAAESSGVSASASAVCVSCSTLRQHLLSGRAEISDRCGDEALVAVESLLATACELAADWAGDDPPPESTLRWTFLHWDDALCGCIRTVSGVAAGAEPALRATGTDERAATESLRVPASAVVCKRTVLARCPRGLWQVREGKLKSRRVRVKMYSGTRAAWPVFRSDLGAALRLTQHPNTVNVVAWVPGAAHDGADAAGGDPLRRPAALPSVPAEDVHDGPMIVYEDPGMPLEDLPEQEAHRCAGVAAQLLRAVCHLHCREPPVVHAQISTASVHVGKAGRVRLAGVDGARTADSRDAPPRLFSSDLCSNACFQAPELLLPTGRLLPSADVFSVGCVLFSMLTGEEPPLEPEQLPEAVAEAALPDPWCAIVARCVSQDEAARPSAALLLAHVEALAAAEPRSASASDAAGTPPYRPLVGVSPLRDRCVEVSPGDEEEEARLFFGSGEVDAEWMAERRERLLEIQRLKEQLQSYDSTLADGDSPPHGVWQGVAERGAARCFADVPEEDSEAMLSVADRFPGTVYGELARGVWMSRSGAPASEAAEQMLKAATLCQRRDGADARPARLLGSQLIQAEAEEEDAKELLLRAADVLEAAQDDGDAATALARARSCAAAGDVETARATLESAVRACPDSRVLHANLAHLLHTRLPAESDLAAHHYEAALALPATSDVDEATVWGLYGSFLVLRGDRSGALDAFRRSLAKDASHKDNLFNAGLFVAGFAHRELDRASRGALKGKGWWNAIALHGVRPQRQAGPSAPELTFSALGLLRRARECGHTGAAAEIVSLKQALKAVLPGAAAALEPAETAEALLPQCINGLIDSVSPPRVRRRRVPAAGPCGASRAAVGVP